MASFGKRQSWSSLQPRTLPVICNKWRLRRLSKRRRKGTCPKAGLSFRIFPCQKRLGALEDGRRDCGEKPQPFSRCQDQAGTRRWSGLCRGCSAEDDPVWLSLVRAYSEVSPARRQHSGMDFHRPASRPLPRPLASTRGRTHRAAPRSGAIPAFSNLAYLSQPRLPQHGQPSRCGRLPAPRVNRRMHAPAPVLPRGRRRRRRRAGGGGKAGLRGLPIYKRGRRRYRLQPALLRPRLRPAPLSRHKRVRQWGPRRWPR